MNSDFVVAARSLLLPIAPTLEAKYLDDVAAFLSAANIAEADHANWLTVALRRWVADGAPSPVLKKLVQTALYKKGRQPLTYMFDEPEGDERWVKVSQAASKNYFEVYDRLIANHLFSKPEARQLLSHAGTLARLAVSERMTASEISRILAVKDRRFDLNWKVIEAILNKIGCKRDLTPANVAATFQNDTEQEPLLFGDLDLEGSIRLVADHAIALGCSAKFADWLADLFINDLHPPYLLIVHYQLLIQEWFDHAVTYAYEFAPRGKKVEFLTDRYINSGIPVARNAFLNNAKATLRFDGTWVTGRDDHLRGAAAVSNILTQIESLSALAKVELAARIRGLLHRYIRVSAEKGGPLPHKLAQPSAAQIDALMASVGAANSATTGIVEQRLVDCVGATHHDPAVWSERGLGDSVFAANVFRRKFGDVEFERPDKAQPRIEAYESHGGKLSRLYVDDHVDSFGRVLEQRQEDLEAIAALGVWTFKVTFLAHQFEAGLPPSIDIVRPNLPPVTLELGYVLFADALQELGQHPQVGDVLRDQFITPLNDPYVHYRVRQRTLDLMT